MQGKKALVLVHGGAGAIRKELIAGAEDKFQGKLVEAVQAGYKVLKKGGSSLDAAIAAVMVLENASDFNAGRGSCLTKAGKIEMDAAVMDGATLNAGAVASINCVKNPVLAARAVMEHSPHVLLVGPGAHKFIKHVADIANLKIVDPDSMKTKSSVRKLKLFLEEQKKRDDCGPPEAGLTTGSADFGTRAGKGVKAKKSAKAGRSPRAGIPPEDKYGTVGAVARDLKGHLAAATSTGGIIGKAPGRIGDTPLIGAGTFADDESCAVSTTGHGEHFIRCVLAHEINALIRYAGCSLPEAVHQAIFEKLARTGGEGGAIAIDPQGNYCAEFNTSGMFRAVIREDGSFDAKIF